MVSDPQASQAGCAHKSGPAAVPSTACLQLDAPSLPPRLPAAGASGGTSSSGISRPPPSCLSVLVPLQPSCFALDAWAWRTLVGCPPCVPSRGARFFCPGYCGLPDWFAGREVLGNADRVLIYLTLWIQKCLSVSSQARSPMPASLPGCLLACLPACLQLCFAGLPGCMPAFRESKEVGG